MRARAHVWAAAVLTAAALGAHAQPRWVLDPILSFGEAGDWSTRLADRTRGLPEVWGEAVRSAAGEHGYSKAERCGGRDLPGFFLHPASNEDAWIEFQRVQLPSFALDERLFLLFWAGIRDGVPWEAAAPPQANGVRFSVVIDGRTLHTETLTESRWQLCAAETTRHYGAISRIRFTTHAIDGDADYDWAVVGRPVVAVLRSDPLAAASTDPLPGLVLDRMGGGDGPWRAFERGAGEAAAPAAPEVLERLHARFLPKLTVGPMVITRGLLLPDEPFDATVDLRNDGFGDAPAVGAVSLDGWAAPPQPIPVVPAGGRAQVRWNALELPGPEGERSSAFPNVEGVEPHPYIDLALPCQNPESVLRDPNGGGWSMRILESGGYALRLERDQAGFAFLRIESGPAGAPQAIGTIFPLADFWVVGLECYHTVYPIAPAEARLVEPDRVELYGRDGHDPVRIEITRAARPGSYRFRCTRLVPRGTALVRFRGPSILAGDRAFGAAKDIAIFPGLEYLERDERSSSTRDLAPHLADRRVPALHKIAAPIMAVQGGGYLIAMMWDIAQEWAPGERYPAAQFECPAPGDGPEYTRMALMAPSVGRHLPENELCGGTGYEPAQDQIVTIEFLLVLDRAADYPREHMVHGPHRGGLALQVFKHYFDAFGMPEPTPPPRDWEAQKALSMDAYFNAVWDEHGPGWRHCQGWESGAYAAHAVPQLLVAQEGAPPELRAEIERRTGLVIARAMAGRDAAALAAGDGCHILGGELPFRHGHVAEAVGALRDRALRLPDAREGGRWVWRPASPKHAALGTPGGHTLGQAAFFAHRMLRAARLSGDPALIASALDAMRQMEEYDVPRGAQMWECPLYQPDILAAAHAVRAYCEAYRITGDAAHLAHARYWAWSGLPFLYLWGRPEYPTQLYNVISVIGSTFHTHSWLGLPVVWCGLVYAYALQDLAAYDASLDWRRIAEGITNSAMHQQYTDGPSKGCYPDSWDMIENAPRPADINPEGILVNAFRLRGLSPEIDFRRIDTPAGPIMINSAAAIGAADAAGDALALTLRGAPGFSLYTLIAPIAKPASVDGAGARAADSAALQQAEEGWLYAPQLRAAVVKSAMVSGEARIAIGGLRRIAE